MEQPVIKVENLSKLYYLGEHVRHDALRDVLANLFKKKRPRDQFWALKDIDFEVKMGEVVGIIGRNGSGKSTLLKVLSQITPPSTGKITLRGRVASLLEIGTGFHPELTGRENIYLNGAILGMTRNEIKHKFNDIIKFAEIDKFLDTPVKHYSSGMRVRLAFAVAAHLESEILLVDEVLAVGDLAFQKKCLGKMDSISKEGRTILFVSHNMQAIRTLCSRAILLDRARKIYDGDVNSTLNRYENYHTKDTSVVDWQNTGPTILAAQLIKTGILSDGKPIGTEFATEKPLQIYITFKTKAEAQIGTTVLIHNQEDQLLFVSLSNHEPNLYKKTFPIGTHSNICTIPSNLLSPGRYSISIGLWGDPYERGIMERDILHVIARSDGLTRGGNATNTTDYGLIAPLLSWSSRPDDNNSS
ncbi:ATP-binding cassette domain-containing protein [Patescibacteria group bacterium]|nr:ATP-binding cassette domain-containing protein [Patescibacteria group bacterium]